MSHRHVLVLAGGRGERFWPWSRPERPKQLLPLAGNGRSLLAATLERATQLAPAERVMVLTGQDLVEPIRRECPPGVEVVAEPVARNTAPAIALAAAIWAARDPQASFAVLPADHLIEDRDAFAADLDRAFTAAEKEPVLVTFGIRPSAPDTNFGYVRRGARIADRLHRVAAFTEKPVREIAEQYVSAGEYYWNAGIFVWRAGVFLDALEGSRPALAKPFRALAGVAGGPKPAEVEKVFRDLESISVDYAVLEHAPNVLMIEAEFDWDDVGSWGAWARRQPHDARGNVLFGQAVAVDCERCIIVGEDGIAAALGLTDMVVVHAGGSTLSCRTDSTEQVRRVSEAVRARGAS